MRRLAALFSFVVATPAAAVDLEADLGIASDYRDRGVSQSIAAPSASASLGAYFANGWGVSAAAYTLDQAPGGDVELNFTGSYQRSWGAIGFWTVGATYVGFQGRAGTDYGEVFANAGLDYGFAVATVSATYSPDRNDIDGGDNLYGQARLDAYWPGKPYGATATVGYDWFDRLPEKWDWSFGLFYELRSATLSVKYVDTNQSGRGRGATIVGGLKFAF